MSTATTGPIGPVDLAVIGFRGELRQGGIRDAVARAVDQGAVRVLDVLLVRKDDDGSVLMYDAESPEGAEELLGFPTVMPDLVGEEDALAIAAEMDPARRCSSSPGRTCGRPRSLPRCASWTGSCSSWSACRARTSRWR